MNARCFESLKKSVRYIMYSFIHLSKAVTEMCSFKWVIPNFLEIESNNQEST